MADNEQRYMHPQTDEIIKSDNTHFHLWDTINSTDPLNLMWKVDVAGAAIVAIIGGVTVTTPTIANVAMAVPATIYNITLPIGTKRFRIKTRLITAPFHFSYDNAMATYETIFMGSSLEESALRLVAPLTIYFRSTVATTAEITYWI